MTTTLTAFIVDDEPDARQALEMLLQKEFPQIKITAQTDNAQNALELIMDKSPDLLFLDIQMPGKDGFWLAGKISKLKIKPCIIFVTAYDEYAIKAIKYAAFDFLTKPVIPEVLRETITRFNESYAENNNNQKFDRLNEFLNRNKIKFNTFEGFILLDYTDIIFCEADANYCSIHLVDGKKEIVTLQLGAVEKKLSEFPFIRANRSLLININFIEKFNRQKRTVSLSDGFQKYEFKVSSSGIKKLKEL